MLYPYVYSYSVLLSPFAILHEHFAADAYVVMVVVDKLISVI